MRHIHLDLLGGLAGDMFLAGAIDCDLVDVRALEETLSSLGVGQIRTERERVRRGALAGTHVRFAGWDPDAESDHRHLSTILEMLDEAALPEAVRDRAKAMFVTLGRSESAVHDIPLETVHFHECGALDSIFDFVSAAWILETVEATWSFGPVPTGHGTVETDHGTVPVPVPATARLLAGIPTIARDVQAELVTPTGAAILRTLHQDGAVASRPAGIQRAVGYGCGTRQLAELSNVVRFLVIETADTARPSGLERDHVCQLTCEIDDMSPELLAHAEQVLLDQGALDVVREPVLMKKGRSGVRLSVLCRPDERERIAELVLRHTSSFGLRVETHERLKLARRLVEVDTDWGAVRVKLGYIGDEVVQASPEYDDCARLAAATGQPVAAIYDAARRAAAE